MSKDMVAYVIERHDPAKETTARKEPARDDAHTAAIKGTEAIYRLKK